MAKRSALGKGLGAFFGDDVVREADEHRNGAKDLHGEMKGPVYESNADGSGEAGSAGSRGRASAKSEAGIRSSRDSRTEDSTADSAENWAGDNTANWAEDSTDKRAEGSTDKRAEGSTDKRKAKGKEAEAENVSRETFIKITEIEPNQEQPRKKFDEESLQELADSMKEYGVLQPLLVKKTGDTYQIIAGERRWRAAKLAGLKEVPVIIREYDRQQSVEIALIENVQRADLNPIEEAMAYQQLMQEFGMKQEDIAARVSKNRVTITNSVRLLKLPETVRTMLVNGELSSGHARALLALEEKSQQEELAKKIVEKGLSVRETERIVKSMTKPLKEKKEEKDDRDLSFIFHDLEERMKGIMGTKVMIHQKDKNKGRIEIEYYSASELERIVELIESIR